jgi:hypothetical protein
MEVFTVIGALAGITLGLRFKVLVLVPAILFATVIIIARGHELHELKVIALTVFGTAVALQIGYIVGCMLRVITRAYLPARRRVHFPPAGSTPAH